MRSAVSRLTFTVHSSQRESQMSPSMKCGAQSSSRSSPCCCGAITGSAHHPISAKFDDTKPQTLNGVVTLVDWRNPHVHIYMNVRNNNDADNWAIETREPHRSAGQRLDARLAAARRCDHGRRNLGAERQPAAVGHQGHDDGDRQAGAAASRRSRRRLCWRTGPRRAGPTSSPGLDRAQGGAEGYWAFPSSTVLVENAADYRDGSSGDC